jgi:multimeric flavodoxin WrbA
LIARHEIYPDTADKKKALVLFGSPRQNGYTSQLVHEFTRWLEPHYDFITVDAYREKISPCTACGYCEKKEGCCIKDFERIHGLLCSSDLLIVASPIYNLSFPAPLKAILDRMQRYFSARFSLNIRPPIKKHKRSALLLTSGADCDEGAAVMRRQLEMIYTVINATLEQQVIWKNTDRASALEPLTDEVRRAALSFLIE